MVYNDVKNNCTNMTSNFTITTRRNGKLAVLVSTLSEVHYHIIFYNNRLMIADENYYNYRLLMVVQWLFYN